MKDYNTFVNDRLNEEAEFGSSGGVKKIGGLLKNLFGKLLKDVGEAFAKPVEELNKKLGNQKGIEEMSKTVKDHLLRHRETLVTQYEESKTLPSVLKTTEDGINSAYASIKASIDNFGKESYTFDEIFKDAPERTRKLFSKNAKNFEKRYKSFSEALILSLGKPYKVTEDMLTEENVEAANDDTVQKVGQGENPDEIPQGQVQEEKKTISPEDLTKLKEDIQNWFDKTIYKTTKDSVEGVLKGGDDAPAQETGDVNDAIDNIPADITKNKESVKNMVNKLAKSDMQTMKKVRDALGLSVDDAPL